MDGWRHRCRALVGFANRNPPISSPTMQETSSQHSTSANLCSDLCITPPTQIANGDYSGSSQTANKVQRARAPPLFAPLPPHYRVIEPRVPTSLWSLCRREVLLSLTPSAFCSPILPIFSAEHTLSRQKVALLGRFCQGHLTGTARRRRPRVFSQRSAVRSIGTQNNHDS